MSLCESTYADFVHKLLVPSVLGWRAVLEELMAYAGDCMFFVCALAMLTRWLEVVFLYTASLDDASPRTTLTFIPRPFRLWPAGVRLLFVACTYTEGYVLQRHCHLIVGELRRRCSAWHPDFTLLISRVLCSFIFPDAYTSFS